MASSSEITSALKQLHMDALPAAAKRAFLSCVEMPFFKKEWYLAGGTALAIQAGHRQSVDLDFFIPKKSFAEKKAEELLSVSGHWKTMFIKQGTLYGKLEGAKISLIAYPFFRPRESFLKIGTVSILKPGDIAVMKIIALSQRGKKRDFFDLYWISNNIQPLLKSVEAVQKQYAVKQNLTHILKSLVYFDDAEQEPMPLMLKPVDWRKVKEFFREEVSKIAV